MHGRNTGKARSRHPKGQASCGASVLMQRRGLHVWPRAQLARAPPGPGAAGQALQARLAPHSTPALIRNCTQRSAPRPRVSCAPICSLFRAWWFSSACASVLTAQNSTPCRTQGSRDAVSGHGSCGRERHGHHRMAAAAAHRQAAGDHAVHGIAAATAAADDLDARVACRQQQGGHGGVG